MSEVGLVISARVVSLTMLRATEAPMPALLFLSAASAAMALVEVLADEVADSETSDPLASIDVGFADGGPRPACSPASADVLTVAMFSAKAPATETLPPPAPEVASAPKWWSVSPLAPPVPGPMPALALTPCELIVTPRPMSAAFVTSARLIATAAPMPAPLADEACRCPRAARPLLVPVVATAEASAVAVASAFCSVSRTTGAVGGGDGQAVGDEGPRAGGRDVDRDAGGDRDRAGAGLGLRRRGGRVALLAAVRGGLVVGQLALALDLLVDAARVGARVGGRGLGVAVARGALGGRRGLVMVVEAPWAFSSAPPERRVAQQARLDGVVGDRSATETPMAALPAAASPWRRLHADAVCTAQASSLPLSVSVVPVSTGRGW